MPAETAVPTETAVPMEIAVPMETAVPSGPPCPPVHPFPPAHPFPPVHALLTPGPPHSTTVIRHATASFLFMLTLTDMVAVKFTWAAQRAVGAASTPQPA